MTKPSILIAGIGNIFHGDDAFGLEVIRRLSAYRLPPQARVVDIGIRSIDLAFALMDGYDLNILVDTVQRGGNPGTLYLIEPDLDHLDGPETGSPKFDPHGMDPVRVLRMAKDMGGNLSRVLVLGCEPESFGPEDEGRMGLSAVVEQAVDPAAKRIEMLVAETLTKNIKSNAHAT
jgi:hydrogenase maturation protease